MALMPFDVNIVLVGIVTYPNQELQFSRGKGISPGLKVRCSNKVSSAHQTHIKRT